MPKFIRIFLAALGAIAGVSVLASVIFAVLINSENSGWNKAVETKLDNLMEQGDAGAHHELGVMYDQGRLVKPDHEEAFKWFRMSAEQGNAEAQFYLGAMYHQGRGVAQDLNEAIRWYRRSGDQGDARALFNLGSMYGNGQGVDQNLKIAFKFYHKAADQGEHRAQYNLGVSHAVQGDYVKAHFWYSIAGSNGSESGADNQAEIAKKMTSAQIAEAQILAREWMEKHP